MGREEVGVGRGEGGGSGPEELDHAEVPSGQASACSLQLGAA